ncbi:MAG TPA: DUF3103 family protein [Tahibacter sp.]|uniref:DUF3103 family protein n=1 Tax=Tahibacter sp. TaxID=2056211 RepID=UPI002CF03090|nr:DUF3103 family protein [Tahibacter sp.]HSX58660.1 DUF3103 family protein [Tahibacter sp.]
MRSLRSIVCGLVAIAGISGAAAAARLDVSDPVAYTAAHRALAVALRDDLQSRGTAAQVQSDLVRHGREMALRELCARCGATAKSLGADDAYEPGVWLFQGQEAAARDSQVLIAFPPAGDDKAWTTVDALTLDGRWVQLDARTPPAARVLVVRVNGALSFERQIDMANAQLREAGLQTAAAPSAKGSGHWTTRLESIRLNDDEEPWVSGAAEVYAITAGILPGNQAQVTIVDMPYLDHDGTTYYPRQVLLDWNQYSYGAANVLIYEHDDNTNYQTLVGLLIQAIGQGGSLAGYPAVQAIAEIAARIVAAMPAGWFSNDDDYVDSIYTIEKTRGETRYGAGGNVYVNYIPYELPTN